MLNDRFTSRSICRVLTQIAVLMVTAAGAHAQDGEAQELRRRVAELETKVAFLEQILTRLNNGQLPAGPLPTPPASSNAPSPAQEAEAQPAPLPQRQGFATPPELVPEIGKIGAEVGLLLSGSANPFHLNNGQFVAGFIDLPLVDKPDWLHGKISYEISVGMSQSKTPMTITSNVAQVSNLTLLTALNPAGGLNNVVQAVTGTGSAPFPVTTPVTTKLRLLEVVPFSFKYTTNVLDRWRLRPYALLGFGTYVTIHVQYPQGNGLRPDAQLPPDIAAAVGSLFGGKAPFGGPLVAGQLSQAPELEQRGLPGGHGNLDFGYVAGGGFEYRVSRSLSLGFDTRYNRIAGAPGSLVTYGTRIGVHF